MAGSGWDDWEVAKDRVQPARVVTLEKPTAESALSSLSEGSHKISLRPGARNIRMLAGSPSCWSYRRSNLRRWTPIPN